MRTSEFSRCVASEHERTVKKMAAPRELLETASRAGGMSLTDFLAGPRPVGQERDVVYRHILGAATMPSVVDARPELRGLPADLRALILQVNGIHLWANGETGRAYFGLAPIEEWEPLRSRLGDGGGRLGERYLAISYHQDEAAFIVLDLESGVYFLMDAAGPDTTSPIARNVEELLDWLWRSRIAPTP